MFVDTYHELRAEGLPFSAQYQSDKAPGEEGRGTREEGEGRKGDTCAQLDLWATFVASVPSLLLTLIQPRTGKLWRAYLNNRCLAHHFSRSLSSLHSVLFLPFLSFPCLCRLLVLDPGAGSLLDRPSGGNGAGAAGAAAAAPLPVATAVSRSGGGSAGGGAGGGAGSSGGSDNLRELSGERTGLYFFCFLK